MFAADREESLVATLTIEVTDETYARLQQRALAIGSRPEAIASADVARLSPPKPGELLRPWIGSIDLGVSDAGINHDRYIGDSLVDEHRGPAR